MSLAARVVAQFARPTGFWGQVVGLVMAYRPSNLERNEWAVSLLNLQPADRVLEIGFGPGVTIQKMSQRVRRGMVWGIDHSEVMLRRATSRNRRAIAAGRVRLALASASQLPVFDGPFDKILDVNGFQFWSDKVDALKRLRAQLRPGGFIALVHQPRSPCATEGDATAAGETFARYLAEAGFERVEIQKKRMKPVSAVGVLGRAHAAAPD